jgi:monoterpene epsilon-lactone hydrolase
MPSPELAQIVALLRSRPVTADVTLEGMRRGLEDLMSMIPVPADVDVEPTVAGGLTTSRPAELLTPPGAEKGRAVLYLHGGAYVLGSPKSHRELAARIGRAARSAVVVLDYRLAPEHPFPAAVDDAFAAYRWILDSGTAPQHVAIAGDSAGGGLTVAMLLAARDAGAPMPGAAALLSPWTDLEGTGASVVTNAGTDPMVQMDGLHFMARLYVGGGDIRHPRISSIHADLAGLPPLLIQAGKAEALLDDSVRLADRARASGVDVTLELWDDMIHVFQAFSMLPEGQQAVAQIGEFIRRRTALV